MKKHITATLRVEDDIFLQLTRILFCDGKQEYLYSFTVDTVFQRGEETAIEAYVRSYVDQVARLYNNTETGTYPLTILYQ
jgi:hypothetical protein